MARGRSIVLRSTVIAVVFGAIGLVCTFILSGDLPGYVRGFALIAWVASAICAALMLDRARGDAS
jgi:hypothetical protein